MDSMAWWAWAIIIWFAISIPANILESISFYIHLARTGARPRFLLSNNPQYLRRLYLRWCRENHRPPDKRRLAVQRCLLLNLLASIAAFVALSAFYLSPPGG